MIIKRTVMSVVLVVAIGACVAPKNPAVDPTLPESMSEVALVSPSELLVKASAVDEPSVRGRALELLITHAREPAGGSFALRALMDPDPWIQHRAVMALSLRLNEPETVGVLSEYLGRTDTLVNPYAQGAAGLRLIQAGRVDAVKPHSTRYQALSSRPWDAAPHALVSSVLGDKRAVEVLADVLRRADLPLEIEFIVDLAQSGLKDLAPALEAGQEMVEEEMSLAFALCRLALGDVGGEHILRAALNHEDEAVRMEALDLLARLDGTEELLQRAASHKRHVTRWYGELALIGRGERSVDGLAKAIQHENRMVREYAARFARRVMSDGSKRPGRIARQVVKTGLADEDPIVRLEAIKSAAALDLRTAKEGIESHLVDEVRAVRVEAAGALLALEGRQR